MHAADQLRRGRRAAQQHAPERREVAARAVGMIEQHDDLRRDAAQGVQALALDRLEHGGRVEGVVDERRAALRELDGDARHGADVREGEARGEVLRGGRGAARVAARLDLRHGEKVPVREAGALRHAGRAAGEHDGDRVVGGDRDGRRGAAPAQVRDGSGRARGEARGREPDHLAELGQPRAEPLHRVAEVGVVPALDGEQEGCARAAEDVPDLRPPVAHVDAGRDRAEARGAEVGNQVEGRGRQEERHHVAAADAACGEGRGGPVGERVPVAVGEALAPVAEGLGVGRLARGRAEEIAERAGAGHESTVS